MMPVVVSPSNVELPSLACIARSDGSHVVYMDIANAVQVRSEELLQPRDHGLNCGGLLSHSRNLQPGKPRAQALYASGSRG